MQGGEDSAVSPLQIARGVVEYRSLIRICVG